jgi:hypothetical protein
MPGFTGDLDVDLERGLAECGLAVENRWLPDLEQLP